MVERVILILENGGEKIETLVAKGPVTLRVIRPIVKRRLRSTSYAVKVVASHPMENTTK